MSREPMERFEQGWRQWASRPPRLRPEEAATRVRARLDQRKSPSRLPVVSRLATAIVLALAIGFGWWQTVRPGGEPATVSQPPAGEIPPALGEDVMLIWLDAETPLYMTVRPVASPGTAQGDMT